ncbi:metallophosphoesterase [Herbivorax sp. ANBcel31]|uniref:metallophosphoesterase n=1 Tax=Herbivorax sp. ANBcel31 TaxID=3069754 RepID=UPI0027B11CFE|nr:metallophosphoesterase [Herbivorax sp. ANBcel31]MDQ2086674.1 metallophosphoesterase [Herbivorax sp. ANBcel31]
MAVYAISDLHLSYGVNKPMDIFGDRWVNYMDKLKENWEKTIKRDDYTLIPGDISWATYLDQAKKDFEFIENLPGRKIISKGNHDYWWTTMSKLKKFLENNNFKTIDFMHNNSYNIQSFIVCGARGWKCPGDDGFTLEDKKIYERELNRLELSLNNVDKDAKSEDIIVMMHYPPFNSSKEPSGFVEIMREYGVKKCLYGHLHGISFNNAVEGKIEGIDFKLVSSDYLSFMPFDISKDVNESLNHL